MNTVDVLDSQLAYTESGRGAVPVVFLHGNPTSSYLWRNVIPHVAPHARCLAPDLIGMGASGKPDCGYRFLDHARYLDAWFDALELNDVVLVGHDWGGALGMHWAARFPERVRGLALIETFLFPLTWSEMPPVAADLFRRFRSAEGEQMILQENHFIEGNLRMMVPQLTAADLDAYRAPYPTPESRLPMLAWPREFPLEGTPAEVVEIVTGYGRWMAESPAVPKLLMHVEPGVGMGSPEAIARAAATFASVEVESVGPGKHHAPEDQPDAIGQAVTRWLLRHDLTAPTPATMAQ